MNFTSWMMKTLKSHSPVNTTDQVVSGRDDEVPSPDTVSLSGIFTLISRSEDLLKWDVEHGPTQAHLLGIVSSQFSVDDGVRGI
jgi:hypothetical protein